jgi:hypothetical protein
MKKNVNILLVVFVLIFSIFSIKTNAQQTDENTFIINKYFQNINNAQIVPTTNNYTNQNLTVNKYANNAELYILQSGNFNYVNINSGTNSQNINQVGDKNSYEFISFYGRDDLNFEAQQIGNNNYIQVLGENSLINNMKIIQKSDFKTITIKNF